MAAPTVPDYNPTTPEDTVLNGQVVGTDPDGDPITYLLGAQATNGVAVVNADGTYTYTPNLNYNGPDQFTVFVRDDQLGEATSTVNVTVTAVNDAPVNTVPGAQTTAEDTVLAFSGAKLITVADVDGQTLNTTVSVTNGVLNVTLGGGATISAGANNSASMQLTGSAAQINAALATLTYTPTLNYNGAAVLTVLTSDGAASDTDTVAITVTAVNDPPVNTVPGAQSVAEDTVLTFNGAKLISVADVDGNVANTKLTVTNGVLNVTLGGGATISAGANNSATLTLAGTQAQINAALATLTYTPTPNFNGSASLQVLTTDGAAATDTDTVAITVTAVNDPPTVPNYNHTTPEDTPVSGTAVGADIDAGAVLTYTKGVGPTNGTATVNSSTGAYTYTPNANYNGPDSFTIVVSDGTASATSTISLTVTAVNDPPVVPNYTPTVAEDTQLTGTVVATDVEGNPLTYAKGTGPTHGTATVNANGTWTYMPAANYHGADQFTVVVSDGQGGSATSTISITVTPVNDGPTAVDDDVTAQRDTTLVIPAASLLANDTDPDGDTLTVQSVQGAQHGNVSLSGTDISFQPDMGFVGDAAFEYTVSDGHGGTASAMVWVTVEIPPPPTLAEVKAKIAANETLTYEDFGVLYAAAKDKLNLVLDDIAALGGTLSANYDADDLSSSSGLLSAMADIATMIGLAERKKADLAKGEVTEAQNTKMKELVTAIDL